MYAVIVLSQGYRNKNIGSAALSYGAFTVTYCNFYFFTLNIVTVKRNYRYHGITTSYLPSQRYYREIFPVPAVITVVTAVLPLFPLPCHPPVESDFIANSARDKSDGTHATVR